MGIPARVGAAVATSVMLVTGGVVVSSPATAHGGHHVFDNCTKLHKKWEHGVGKRHAHDETSGTPVTNFKRSTRLYRKAYRHNHDLDRDRDKIACEQA